MQNHTEQKVYAIFGHIDKRSELGLLTYSVGNSTEEAIVNSGKIQPDIYDVNPGLFRIVETGRKGYKINK